MPDSKVWRPRTDSNRSFLAVASKLSRHLSSFYMRDVRPSTLPIYARSPNASVPLFIGFYVGIFVGILSGVHNNHSLCVGSTAALPCVQRSKVNVSVMATSYRSPTSARKPPPPLASMRTTCWSSSRRRRRRQPSQKSRERIATTQRD